MLLGEPTLVFWRVGDLFEAMRASQEMGLPLTSFGVGRRRGARPDPSSTRRPGELASEPPVYTLLQKAPGRRGARPGPDRRVYTKALAGVYTFRDPGSVYTSLRTSRMVSMVSTFGEARQHAGPDDLARARRPLGRFSTLPLGRSRSSVRGDPTARSFPETRPIPADGVEKPSEIASKRPPPSNRPPDTSTPRFVPPPPPGRQPTRRPRPPRRRYHR